MATARAALFLEEPYRRLGINLADPENIIEADVWLQCIYIFSSLLFILALRGLGHQETSKMGNLYGIGGMLAAIVATLASPFVYGAAYGIFVGVCVPPAVVSCVVAALIPMTSIPQMVGMLNAFGGLAATLESFALFFSPYEQAKQNEMYVSPWTKRYVQFQVYQTVFYLVGASVGMITFTGSVVACGKLSGHISSKSRIVPGRIVYTSVIFISIAGTGALAGVYGLKQIPLALTGLCVMTALSAFYGVIFVLAIGGADMPVVISILNSGSGWAGVFAGLTLQNTLMIISGAFVGASGIILSYVMCKAMNRSLYHVLVGGFGDTGSTSKKLEGEPTITTPEELSSWLAEAKSVVFVPGYGMAVSRAQHAIAELSEFLMARKIDVKFGVHPVAGRLPGHMNVLLAEAEVPYDIVGSMEDINPSFPESDVVIVVGANDTVNPAAETDSDSAIYGMPVLQVWKAKQTVVLKRSMNVGYAGVDNPLFLYKNNAMLLGDAKKSLTAVTVALKSIIGNQSIEGPAGSTVIEVHENVVSNCAPQKTPEPLVDALLFLGVLNETKELEKRVSVTPAVALRIRKELKIGVVVESGAGLAAGFTDDEYTEAHCELLLSETLVQKCTIITKVTAFTEAEISLVQNSSTPDEKVFVCGFGSPTSAQDLINRGQELGITIMSLDILPRITTAQKIDILSSTAKLAGYRAVIEAFNCYDRLIGAEITAAGKYPPAKVFIIGAGVAGLQAIGDARRMGAEVTAFDIRLECKEQVESMGGKYLVMDFGEGETEGGYAKPMSAEFISKEMELISKEAAKSNIIITTASIPGRPAPKLLMQEHVDLMQKGSVIIDLAAASGGNCEVTKSGEKYVYANKVTVIGYVDFPSRMASHASDMFANNVFHLLSHCGGGDKWSVNMKDTIVRAITLTHAKEITYPPPRPATVSSATASKSQVPTASFVKRANAWDKLMQMDRIFGIVSIADILVLVLSIAATALFSTTAPPSFPPLLFIFTLSCWVGYLLVWNVAPALHTPLMSVSNAISGVVIIGGMLGISSHPYEELDEIAKSLTCQPGSAQPVPFYCIERGTASVFLNAIAIAVASMNVFGGFAVTHRMLRMFKRRKPAV